MIKYDDDGDPNVLLFILLTGDGSKTGPAKSWIHVAGDRHKGSQRGLIDFLSTEGISIIYTNKNSSHKNGTFFGWEKRPKSPVVKFSSIM